MQEVYDFLKQCGVYYLATVEGDQPRVRPFGTVDIFDGKLYIQTGKSKPVSRQMADNPRVEISAATADGHWIRVQAVAVDDDNRAARVHMLEAYPNLKSLYDPDDGNAQVLYLRDAVATFCSYDTEPREIRF